VAKLVNKAHIATIAATKYAITAAQTVAAKVAKIRDASIGRKAVNPKSEHAAKTGKVPGVVPQEETALTKTKTAPVQTRAENHRLSDSDSDDEEEKEREDDAFEIRPV